MTTNRLPIAERVKLFRQVCGAVHYATRISSSSRTSSRATCSSRRTAIPTARIRDCQDSSPTLTATAIQETATYMRLMTPNIASPEQVRASNYDRKRCLHAGVVLYELLTGSRSIAPRTGYRTRVAHAICETEPEYPSTVISRVKTAANETAQPSVRRTRRGARRTATRKLRRRLAGDLDNIVLMPCARTARRYSLSKTLRRPAFGIWKGCQSYARKDTSSIAARSSSRGTKRAWPRQP